MENSSFCRNILVVSIFSVSFLLGHSFTCMNPLVPVLFTIYNNTYHDRYNGNLPNYHWTLLLSLTMSMVLAGGLCGSMSVRFVLKVLSRKRTMIVAHLINLTGSLTIALGSGLSGSYEAFIIGRFVVGCSLGLGMNTVPVVIAEMSTQQKQGSYQSLMGFVLSISTIFGPIMGHPKVFGNELLWPMVIAVNCVPSVIYLCCSPWIPPTPYSLLREKNRSKAIDLVKKLRIASEEEILSEVETMEDEQLGLKKNKSRDESGEIRKDKIAFVDFKGVIKSSQYRKQFFTVTTIYIGAMTTGINHVALYSDQILLSAGIPSEQVTNATIGIFALQAIFSALAMRLMSSWGSKKMNFVGVMVIVLSHVISTVCLATQHQSVIARYFSIVGLLLTMVGYYSGPNLTLYALAGELTIEPTRPTILNYGGGCLWFTGWLTGFVAPYMDKYMGHYSLLVWAGLSGIYLAFIYFLVPDTKGKSSAEIQKFFQK